MDRRTRITVAGALAALVLLTLAVATAGPAWEHVRRTVAPGSDPTFATWADLACPARDAELVGVMEPSVLRRGERHRTFIFLVNLGPGPVTAQVHEHADRWYRVEGDHLRLVSHGFAISDYASGEAGTVAPLESIWLYRDEVTTSPTLEPGDYVRQLSSTSPRACGVSFFRVAP